MGSNRGRYIGDYRVCEQVGSGSFSVVWRATHRVNGSEFAIKEIHMQRLSRKLQESLLSEIAILRRINHPNIIRLHDSIETPGKIYLVLEYCSGGDLSMYIHDHGKVPEETAKHFMRQLAAGLNVLRENNIIHRDLKPQNLLLSSNDNQSVLKIADFGFARPLQPRDLAETLCGSPLYMAPEIMQLHKYDAKADLWSVGAILFQLVTGRTPFSGNNQDQLRQNIIKSNGIRFPPDSRDLSSACMDLCQKLLRCNPVERLTFEEFFNHQFISGNLLGGSFRMRDDSIGSPARHTDDSSQEDCLPFHLDDDSSGPEANQSFQSRKPSAQTTPLGFPVHARIENPTTSNASVGTNVSSRNIKPSHVPDRIYPTHTSARPSDVMVQQSSRVTEPITMMGSSRVMDSLELIDQDYVLVSGPPVDFSSSTSSVSHAANLRCKSVGSPKRSMNRTPSSSPIPVSGMMIGNTCGSLGSSSSAPSAASLGSVDTGEFLEHPSTDSLTRIRSLQQCASAISEIVSEKIEGSKNMEAFSVQLVILAIWKQALHISHAQAASLAEPSRSQETVERKGPSGSSSQGKLSCSQIEKDFLLEVERAEELARDLGPGNTEMPDAMEIIFQSALVLGRVGGVDELMGNMDSAVSFYEKAIRIFFFLLVEAPSLILNPPFSLTNADRLRLRNYIEILNTRKCQSRSLRMALLSCGDQTSI